MRNAYALLGLSFLIVFGLAFFFLSQKAEAPTVTDDDMFERVTDE